MPELGDTKIMCLASSVEGSSLESKRTCSMLLSISVCELSLLFIFLASLILVESMLALLCEVQLGGGIDLWQGYRISLLA